jgi:hypothetical protein
MCNLFQLRIIDKITDMIKQLPLQVILSFATLLPVMIHAQVPVLKIDNKEDKGVYLRDLSVDVKVVGTIATTTLQMTFFNNYNRILEGELIIPLPEGVSVSRYALDINGKMREAVPVEKAKATQVFESIQREEMWIRLNRESRRKQLPYTDISDSRQRPANDPDRLRPGTDDE